MKVTRLSLAVLALLLLQLTTHAVAAGNPNKRPAAPAAEVRALWVDGFNPGIRTREEAEQLVANAKKAGINTLIVQVRRRADSLYRNGALEPAIEDFTLDPTFDPLANIIDIAHKQGIEVHAWMNAMTIWKMQAPPVSQNHVFNLHGPNATGRDNWLTANPAGNFVFPVGYFFDPGHPDAMQHLVDVYTSVARNYAVDGIHFDYIRYPEIEGEKLPKGSPVGYNVVSVERFRRVTGRTDTPEPGDQQWIDWRRQQVTQLVRRVYLEVKAINPKIKVSAATIAWGKPPQTMRDYPESAPMQLVYQDWIGWMKQGFLDMAVPMNYARDAEQRSRGYFDGWITFEKQNKGGRLLVVGVGSYLNSPEGTLSQVARVRQPVAKHSADGVSFFSYGGLVRSEVQPAANGTAATRTALSSLYSGPTAPFATPAALPHASWIEQPQTGWLAGVARDAKGNKLDGMVIEVRRAGWSPFRRAEKVLTDGNGFFGTTALKPGRYEAKMRTANGEIKSVVEVAAGKVGRTELVSK